PTEERFNMPMTYHEAADIASRCKNFFAAFERLEEVLVLTIGAERVAKEAEDRVQSAAAAADQWRAQAIDQRARFERAKTELAEAVAAAKDQRDATVAECAAEEAQLREEIVALTEQRDALRAAVTELKSKVAAV